MSKSIPLSTKGHGVPKTPIKAPSLVSKHAGNGKSKRKKKRGKK